MNKYRKWLLTKLQKRPKMKPFATSAAFSKYFNELSEEDPYIRALCWNAWRAGRRDLALDLTQYQTEILNVDSKR